MRYFIESDLATRAANRLGVESSAQLSEAVSGAWSMVWGYTRGRGFTEDGSVVEDLAAVIVAAACRVAANPQQVERYQVADYAETPARFLGFDLAEQAVLNRYRKRAL